MVTISCTRARCVCRNARYRFDSYLNYLVILEGWPVEGYLNFHCLPVGPLNTRASITALFICNTS